MALNLTDSGVIATAGRGRNKTVVLEVSFKELEAWAKRVEIDERALWRKSYGRACAALKGRFSKIVRNAGGVEGVPKFHDFEAFTTELRNARGTSSRPMGGVLANKANIVSFKRNGWQVIGWPDALADWAVNFQDAKGDPDFTSMHRKISFWRLGLHNIPAEYAHNPRRVLPEPFLTQVRKYLDQWARGVFFKELAKLMQKRSAA